MAVKKNIFAVVKSLIISYIITGLLLLLTAFLLYIMEPEQTLVSVGILVIYVLSSFLGGLLTGKGVQSRRFFWGMLTGLLYFLLLLLASFLFGGIQSPVGEILTTLALCFGGGTLGGMLA